MSLPVNIAIFTVYGKDNKHVNGQNAKRQTVNNQP
jgi:hypothetical protein